MENYSKEGRKLRPRKNTEENYERQQRGEANPDVHRPSYGDGNGGDRRPYGGRRSFGDRKPSYGEHRSFGDRKPSYGEHKPFGDRKPSYGEHKPFGDRKPSYGEHRSFGDRKPSYGEHKPFGDRKPSYGEQRPFGKKQGFSRKPSSGRNGVRNINTFSRQSDEGISRMINNRPVIDGSRESESAAIAGAFKEEVRLNKFIANSGVCSRREADTLIQAGVVTVNGEVVTELGTKVNVIKDEIRFNGERLKGEEKVYIVMNKPKGYVTTASDPHADKTVMELLKGCGTRVYPVGRLDKNTTGVLMFTNDGEIAERLTHPSYDKKKIYQVILDKPLSRPDFDCILNGVTLSDGDVSADALEYIEEGDERKLGIEIHSGKNRIVRRIFEHLGYTVKVLDRVYFAGLTKKGLKKGEWRYLNEGEANILKMGAYM